MQSLRRSARLAPLLVFAASSLGLWLAEVAYRALSPGTLMDGYRFQTWPSNWMMQTMGLEDMLPFGPRALWYEHVYPPGLDAIRYLLMLPETNAGLPPDSVAVDMRLYGIYCIVFGLLNVIVYLWIRDLTRSGWWALGGTIAWALYPSNLVAMMLLEGTAPSLLFISAAFYFLYRFLKTRRPIYVTGFLAAFLLASLMRSVVQVHVLILLVVAVIVFGWMARFRSWPLQILNVLLVCLTLALPIKQSIMYDTLSVSTFTGYHRVGMLWIDPTTVPNIEYSQKSVDNALAFSSRYNTQETLKDNARLEAAANAFLVHHPVESARALMKSLTITIPAALRPIATYTESLLVEALPSNGPYAWLMSGWRYVLIMLGAVAIVIGSRGRRGSAALVRRYGWLLVFYALVAFPVLFSNRYRPGEETLGPVWTDALRLKTFLEVPAFVLLTYAAYVATGRLRERIGARRAQRVVM